MEPCELTLWDAADRIRDRRLSPVELAESVLSRIDAADGRVGAFVTVTADHALRAARAAESEIANGNRRGPLHGVCVGVKDLVDTRGIRTTASSRVRGDHVPASDAAVLERLADAGAVLVGKTHTHEFANGVITPTTRNPWNLDRIPGGSSGGSAAAVAARMCQGAIGTDTAGSVRIPASVCGTVGLKPTYGRVSRRGVAPLSWSLDHVGVLARTVRDVALLMDAIAGYDRADPATCEVPVPDHGAELAAGVEGLVLGVPRNYFWERIDPEVEAAVRAAIQQLESLGARLRDVELPYAELYMGAEFGMLFPEASAYHQETLRSQGCLYEADVRVLLEAGELMPATDYIKALRARTLIQRGWRDMFTGLDAVVAPTLPAVAAKVGELAFTWPGGGQERVSDSYVRTSAPANLTGLPALSVPCGFSAAGLPIGFQIIGRPFDEPRVLRIGAATEAANGPDTEAPVVT